MNDFLGSHCKVGDIIFGPIICDIEKSNCGRTENGICKIIHVSHVLTHPSFDIFDLEIINYSNKDFIGKKFTLYSGLDKYLSLSNPNLKDMVLLHILRA